MVSYETDEHNMVASRRILYCLQRNPKNPFNMDSIDLEKLSCILEASPSYCDYTERTVKQIMFPNITAALDAIDKLKASKTKGIRLNVNLTGATYDKYGRLEPGEFKWSVSHA